MKSQIKWWILIIVSAILIIYLMPNSLSLSVNESLDRSEAEYMAEKFMQEVREASIDNSRKRKMILSKLNLPETFAKKAWGFVYAGKEYSLEKYLELFNRAYNKDFSLKEKGAVIFVGAGLYKGIQEKAALKAKEFGYRLIRLNQETGESEVLIDNYSNVDIVILKTLEQDVYDTLSILADDLPSLEALEKNLSFVMEDSVTLKEIAVFVEDPSCIKLCPVLVYLELVVKLECICPIDLYPDFFAWHYNRRLHNYVVDCINLINIS